jgi:hypothetical protein
MALPDVAAAVAWLRTPQAIRARAGLILAAAERGALEHFALDAGRLDPAADYVIETIRASYPALDIPYHSRWRHFAVGGRDRWAALAAGLDADRAELARARFDLVVTSVLLDAGAGDRWRYAEPATGDILARSEGLAVASLDLFRSGALSADPAHPLRADAEALLRLDDATLGAAFQVAGDNPLVGLAGRCRLLNQLGATLAARPAMFGAAAQRIGGLFDHLAGQAVAGRLPAAAILAAVLDGFGEIWPGRIELGGVNLGDVGRHPAAASADPTSGLVPFHKLSQWLAYSLIEPLEDAGIRVTDLDQLTALAEYRNGGLLIDLDILRPKHAAVLGAAHQGGSEIVVEWRALTVALIERLAERIRSKLGLSAAALPLAKVLEGGTWAAGRRVARERRPGGGPPLQIVSDGTLF